jgi:hypothetical protein
MLGPIILDARSKTSWTLKLRWGIACVQLNMPPQIVWNRSWSSACTCLPTLGVEADNETAHPNDFQCFQALNECYEQQEPVLTYVPLASLKPFYEHVWPEIHPGRRIVLVTGRADRGPAASLGLSTIPRWPSAKGQGEHADVEPSAQSPLADILGDPRLLTWWSENLDFQHLKARPLPIGIDLHTLGSAKQVERSVWGGPASPETQAEELLAARRKALQQNGSKDRDSRVYVHFGLINRRRLAVLQSIKDHPCYAIAQGMPGATAPVSAGKEGAHYMTRGELWEKMAAHRWVASVEGYGLDCHRTWEALYLGCGVVVQDVPCLRTLLHGFPAFFVQGAASAWATHVTKQVLDEAWGTWEQGQASGALPPVEQLLTVDHWTQAMREWRPEERDGLSPSRS